MLSTASKPELIPHLTVRRDRESLLAALAVIERQGWDGIVATELLSFVREDLVRPLVIGVGLCGGAATQAEATGWATAWEMLADPKLRQAQSPWGVLWTAVRRAILAEQVAGRYGVTPRNGWRLAGAGDTGPRTPPPVSLTALTALGWEPADRPSSHYVGLGPILTSVVEAMNEVGWDQADAELLVGTIAETITRAGVLSSQLTGWRRVLKQVDLPAWRVRRVTVLLVGVSGWPGLVERIVTDGPEVLGADDVQACGAQECRPHADGSQAAR